MTYGMLLRIIISFLRCGLNFLPSSIRCASSHSYRSICGYGFIYGLLLYCSYCVSCCAADCSSNYGTLESVMLIEQCADSCSCSNAYKRRANRRTAVLTICATRQHYRKNQKYCKSHHFFP